MFCTKCGSQIVDGAKFCNKCGSAVVIPNANPEPKVEVKLEPKAEAKPEPKVEVKKEAKPDKKDKEKKTPVALVILIIILALIFVGLSGILGYKLIEKKNGSGMNQIESDKFEDDDDEDKDDEDKESDDESDNEDADENDSNESDVDKSEDLEAEAEAEAEDEAPLAVKEEEETVAEEAPAAEEALAEIEDNHRSVQSINLPAVNALINTVKDNTENMEAHNFFSNLYDNITYVKMKYEVSGKKRMSMDIDDAREIMANTMGYDNVDSLPKKDGGFCYRDKSKVYFCPPDFLGKYWEEPAQVVDIKDAGNGQFIVDAEYRHGVDTELFVDRFRVVLVENEESVFDGLMVENIGRINTDHYLVPDCQVRVYDISEFKFKDKDTVQLAINEIFARNGRIFSTNIEARDYFLGQSWYEPLVEEMDTTDLTDIERKNIDVLSAYKKKLK